MKKLFVILFTLVFLTACGAPVTGVVVDKDFDRGYTKRYERTERYSCGTEHYTTTSNGKYRTASRTKYCSRTVPDTRRISDSWDITVRDEKGQLHEINVHQGDYLAYKLGDTYPKATR